MKTNRLNTDRVVAAAAHIADRKGLDGLSLSSVARALGVRTPSLYTHVGGLAELRRLVGLAGLSELNERIARAAVGKTTDEAAMAAARAYRDFCHERPGSYAAALRTAPSGDAEWNRAREAVMETIELVLKGFGLTGEEETHAIRGFRSIVHGFAGMEAAGAFRNAVARDRSFAWILGTYIAGLRSGS